MKPVVAKLRRLLSHHDGLWVRAWRSGEISVGTSRYDTDGKRHAKIRQDLEAAGYTCSQTGKPGTAGAFIIEVIAA